MKKFARFLLITILVTVIAGAGSYFVLKSQLPDTFTAVTRLYVVTGPSSSIHTADGGLNKTCEEIIMSDLVLNAAQRLSGTTEDLKEYITASTVAGSDFIDIICENPDASTATRYSRKTAEAAVTRIQEMVDGANVTIYSYTDADSRKGEKKGLTKYSLLIAACAAGVCVVIGFFVMLFGLAFKTKEEDDEAEYYRNYSRDREFKTSAAPKKAQKDEDDGEAEGTELVDKKTSEKDDKEAKKASKKDKKAAKEEKLEEKSETQPEPAKTEPKPVETKEEAAARYRAEFEARAKQQAAEKARQQKQQADDMLRIQLEAMEQGKNNAVKPVSETGADKKLEEKPEEIKKLPASDADVVDMEAKLKAQAEEAKKAAEAEMEAAKIEAAKIEAAKIEAEAKAKAEAERLEKERLEEEARRAENLRLAEEARKAEAARLAEEAAKAKAEAEAKAKAEAEAKAKAEAEAKAKAEAEAKAKAEAEAKAKAEAEAKAKAEAEAKAKAEAEAKAKAAEEAKKAKAYKILERIPK